MCSLIPPPKSKGRLSFKIFWGSDFTKIKENPPASIHHQLGNQMVMMNFSEIDARLQQYIKFFSDSGSAFRLKPDHLRYFDKVIPKPKPQQCHTKPKRNLN